MYWQVHHHQFRCRLKIVALASGNLQQISWASLSGQFALYCILLQVTNRTDACKNTLLDVTTRTQITLFKTERKINSWYYPFAPSTTLTSPRRVLPASNNASMDFVRDEANLHCPKWPRFSKFRSHSQFQETWLLSHQDNVFTIILDMGWCRILCFQFQQFYSGAGLNSLLCWIFQNKDSHAVAIADVCTETLLHDSHNQ